MRCSIDGKLALALAAVLSVPLSGCARAVSAPFESALPSAEVEGENWSPNEIHRVEIQQRGKNHHTAMAIIRRLRPSWLRARGQKSLVDASARYPVVYVDEIRHGGLGTLHTIPAGEILSMEYFSMADATTRWGTGHPSGVINVVTGR